MVIKNKWILLPIAILLTSCSTENASQKIEFLNEKNLQSYQTLKITTQVEIDGEKLTGSYTAKKTNDIYHVEYSYWQFNTIDLDSENQDYLIERSGSFDYDIGIKNQSGDEANLNIYLLTLKDFAFKSEDYSSITTKENMVSAYVNDFAKLFHFNAEIDESIINVKYNDKIEHLLFKNTASKYILTMDYSFTY